jgi:hypothetical protein
MGLSWATTHNSEPQSPFKLTINFNVTVNKKVIIVNLQFNLPVASLPHHFLRPHDHISILVLDTHVLWLITLTMLIHTLFHASIPHLFIPWIQLIANIRPNKHFSLASLHFCLIFLLILPFSRNSENFQAINHSLYSLLTSRSVWNTNV